MGMTIKAAIAVLLLASASSVAAQSLQPMTITFEGTVSNDPDASVVVRSFDPATGYTTTPFTGTVPDNAYQPGDAITFTLKTSLPTLADLTSGQYDQLKAADGTYRFPLVGVNNAGGCGIAAVCSFDVSGPMANVPNAGQPLGGRGLTVAIDPATGKYTLESPDGWLFSKFDTPGYTYDAAAQTLAPSNSSCGSFDCSAGGFALSGTLSSATTDNIPIFGTDGSIVGFFRTLFSGSWFINGQPAGGGATPVPEPSMMLAFGAAAAAILGRRRKRRA